MTPETFRLALRGGWLVVSAERTEGSQDGGIGEGDGGCEEVREGSFDWSSQYFGKLGEDKRCELSDYLNTFAPLYRQRKVEQLEHLLPGITSPLERDDPSEPVSEARTIISGSPFKVAATALISASRLSTSAAAQKMSNTSEDNFSETGKLGICVFVSVCMNVCTLCMYTYVLRACVRVYIHV